MKILVTGGAGFVGSHLVEQFQRDGHNVVVIDNFLTGKFGNIPSGVKTHNVSLLDEDRLSRIIIHEKPDLVSHQAGLTGVRTSASEKKQHHEVNTGGIINLIDACIQAGVRKIVYASSGGTVYGIPQYLPIREDHPTRPINCYGVSKYAAELYLHQAYSTTGLNYTILRYSNLCGPRQKPCAVTLVFISNLLEGKKPTIFGDGTSTRDYVYISDVVEANRLALHGGEGEAYNIGTGQQTSLLELYEISKVAAKHTDAAAPNFAVRKNEEIEHFALDSTKIRNELGWEPKVSVEEGLTMLATWELSNES